MKRILSITAVIGLLVLSAGVVTATKPDKVYVCHAAGQSDTTKFVTLYVPANSGGYPQGHFTEGGTAAAGHETDYLGPCIESTPSPTPEVTPSPTPEVTPAPTPEVTPSPTPEVTPEPTPEVTPEVTPEPTPVPTPTLPVVCQPLPSTDCIPTDTEPVAAQSNLPLIMIFLGLALLTGSYVFGKAHKS